MSLLGQGALVIWHDIENDYDSEYQEWHSKEHMIERVSIAGFHRGHRGRVIGDGPRFINWYEVSDVATLTSAEYLQRLNQPTPWTQKCLGYFRNNNRTLCNVVTSIGTGVSGFLMSVQLSAEHGQTKQLSDWLQSAMPKLVERPGIIGAHYLQGDRSASEMETEEKRLRDGADAIADQVLLIAAYDLAALQELASSQIGASSLRSHGANEKHTSTIYQLAHSVDENNL